MHDERDDSPRRFTIEFDGPEADPHVIDPRSVFEVAARYVDLVRKVAEKTVGTGLSLRGFEVRDKCTHVVLHSDASVEQVEWVSRQVLAITRGNGEIRGTRRAASAFARAVEEADPRLRIGQRDSSGELHVIREAQPRREPASRFHEIDEVRATVIKVGGRNPPRVQLDIKAEPRLRWLDVASEDVVRELAGLLYRQIDADVRIHREGDGHFISGRLLNYRPVLEQSVDEWRAWFSEHLSHWDRVEDIEAALGRGKRDDEDERA
ncbi:MAG: hypothetical protein R3F65_12935 [bacterium]